MSHGPRRDPPGAKPTLPQPTGHSAQRAAALFKRLVATQRGDEPAARPADPNEVAHHQAPAPLPTADSFGGGRRYDLALQRVAELAEVAPVDVSSTEATASSQGWENAADEATVVATPLDVSPAVDPASLPTRPPAGAATVRPPVQRKEAPPSPVSPDALQRAARSAQLVEGADGAMAFDLTFNDEVFQDLACRITVGADGKVDAVFRAGDTNLRRLIEAEAGRLRVALEERGLRVEDVRVELAPGGQSAIPEP